MPITVVWDNEEQTIIRQDFNDEWTWADHAQAVKTTHALIETVAHPVDVIANLIHSRTWPQDPLSYARRNMQQAPPNAGLTVIVLEGGNLFLETLLGIFRRIYRGIGNRLEIVHTLAEARALIASQRDTPQDDDAPEAD